MLLSDIEILERLTRKDEKKIIVSPLINPKKQIGPSSLDVRLGSEFRIFQSQKYTHIDPLQNINKVERDVQLYTKLIQIRLHPMYGGFVIHPGEFVLGHILEFVGLPSDIAARLEGRSSWGRMGLQVHATAGFIDPGFHGIPTLELINLGKVPIILFVGLRIAQLAFHRLSEESIIPYNKRKDSKYGSNIGTVASLYYSDYEFDILKRQMMNEKRKYFRNVIETATKKLGLENTESNVQNLWELIELPW